MRSEIAPCDQGRMAVAGEASLALTRPEHQLATPLPRSARGMAFARCRRYIAPLAIAGVAVPLGAIVAQLVAATVNKGDGGLDHSGLFKLVEELSGRSGR